MSLSSKKIATDFALIFCAALVARLLAAGIIGPGTTFGPETDEFYHLLAARSWMTDGSLRIADGEYTRAYLFTMSLGWLFNLFGESEIAARLLNIFIGSLTVVAVFAWTYFAANRFAAWIAASLYLLCPVALHLSGFIRFYAPHGLVFWLGAIGVYILVTRPLGTAATVATLAGTIAALLLAAHLQITTFIGLAGLAVWAFVVLAPKFLNWAAMQPVGGRIAVLAIPFAIFALGASVAIESGLAERLLTMNRNVPLWNIGNKDNVLYYHYLFIDEYPTLWTLLPLAALFAVARKSKPALFCSIVFFVGILIHSFLGLKWERYIYYLLPFFFVIWGIALAEIFPAVRKTVLAGIDRVFAFRAHRALRGAAGWCGLIAIALFTVSSNSAFPQALKIMLGQSYSSRLPAWTPARDTLQPLLDRAAVVLTTNGLRSLYYFGRYDFEINPSIVNETNSGREFGTDRRTGRRAVGTADSVKLILACYPSGLFLGDSERWRREVTGIDNAAADILIAHSHWVPMPESLGLMAYAWNNDAGADERACARIASLSAGNASVTRPAGQTRSSVPAK